MKFYSEKLDQMFDSMEELQAAEAPKTRKKKATVVANETPVAETAPSRKQLAAAVETAEEAVKEAYVNYESAKVKVEELSKKYLAEVNAILEPAQKAVKDAEKVRYEAIRKFNDSYGAYQVTYTGARAADEMMKAISYMNSRANSLLRDMFWF